MIGAGFEIILLEITPIHQPPPIGLGSNWGWLIKMVPEPRLFDNYFSDQGALNVTAANQLESLWALIQVIAESAASLVG